jgi:hypothetical protein
MRPVFVVASCLIAHSAMAAIYETAVNADDEEDIFAMYQRGDLSQDTADTLLELMREGVDLNTASRERLYDLPGLTYADVDKILLYREQKGRIDDPTELVGIEAITPEQFIGIAPYIRIEPPQTKLPFSGKLRLVSQYTIQDTLPPPLFATGRFKLPFDLSAGFMVTGSRLDPATPRYDPALGLVTDGYRYRPDAPRFFAQWQNGNRRVVLGTYTLGFAERLVLDNTRRVTPKGIYLTDDYRRSQDLASRCRTSTDTGSEPPPECATQSQYVTADYQTRDVFRGVAASLENLELGDQASMSMYGFLSYQSRGIYQYDLYDRSRCEDPRSGSADCGAPRFSVITPTETNTGWRLRYATLPTFFDELAGGGHVDFKPNYRLRFGVTGYGAAPFFNSVPPGSSIQVDFQDTSRYPNGGAYGAIGVDAQAVISEFNLHLEVARSFDRAIGNNGGGFAAIQRTTWAPKNHEVELVLRYYDNRYLNPYARPFSGPDEDAGQRARNELGARLRYFGKPNKDWQLRATADFWTLPFAGRSGPAGTTNLILLSRVDFTGWKFFKPGVWFRISDRNLAQSQRGNCTQADINNIAFEPINATDDFDGDVSFFTCDNYRVAQRFDVRPFGKYLVFIEQAAFTWRDDLNSAYRENFRQDLQVWGELRSQPVDWLQLRVRTRYLNQGIESPTTYEESLWTFGEASWLPFKGTKVSLRYDLYVWLDQRASTLRRQPSPEHRFLLDVRTSF